MMIEESICKVTLIRRDDFDSNVRMSRMPAAMYIRVKRSVMNMWLMFTGQIFTVLFDIYRQHWINNSTMQKQFRLQ